MSTDKDISVEVIEFLLSRQRQTFVAFAKGLVRDEEAAKDIVSEAILSVWEKRDEIQDRQGYLFMAVKNGCLRYRRDSSIHRKAHEHIAQVEQGLEDFYTQTIENSSISEVYEHEIFNILMETLAEMPEDAREIFRLKKFEGKTYKEISKELGVSEFKIDHTLRRVLQRLSEALKDYGPQIAVIAALIHNIQ